LRYQGNPGCGEFDYQSNQDRNRAVKVGWKSRDNRILTAVFAALA
jgi:hypothetical protein